MAWPFFGILSRARAPIGLAEGVVWVRRTSLERHGEGGFAWRPDAGVGVFERLAVELDQSRAVHQLGLGDGLAIDCHRILVQSRRACATERVSSA